MAEKTGIAWCDPAATGRRLGGYKNGARRSGVSLEVWITKHNTGFAWCYRCREWKDRHHFAADKSRNVGVQKLRRECASVAATACRYRITRSDLAALKKKPCAICGGSAAIVVDHCHKTGGVRDGLCSRCNNGLGMFLDDPKLMRKAIAYLEIHSG